MTNPKLGLKNQKKEQKMKKKKKKKQCNLREEGDGIPIKLLVGRQICIQQNMDDAHFNSSSTRCSWMNTSQENKYQYQSHNILKSRALHIVCSYIQFGNSQYSS